MSLFRRTALCLALLAALCLRAHASGKLEIADFKARAGIITAVAISNDGKQVLTGEDDGLVTLWSVTTGTTAMDFVGGHTGEVFAAALLPDGKRALTCGDDNLLITWDLATGKRLSAWNCGTATPLVICCTPDGSLAATACDDGGIIIWRVADGKRVATLRRDVALCGIRFSPDARLLAAGYADGKVILWDTSNWSQKRSLPATPDAASVGALSFSMDGRLLATGNQNGAGFVWNVADGSQVSHFAGYENPEIPPNPPVAPVFPGSTVTPDLRSSIVYVCVSPDGSNVLASIQDESPRFWDTKTGKLLGTADWYEDTRFYYARFGFPYCAAGLTPNRDTIVTFKDNLAQVWRTSFTPNPPQQ